MRAILAALTQNRVTAFIVGAFVSLVRAEISRITSPGRMLRAVIVLYTKAEPQQDEIYPQHSLMEVPDMRKNKIDFLEERIWDYEMTHASPEEIYREIAALVLNRYAGMV